jgi:hypothetical protein|tara:strand:- start:595 stop:840 length:246 start_codon:yes stop_codon:yes gene_type:complete
MVDVILGVFLSVGNLTVVTFCPHPSLFGFIHLPGPTRGAVNALMVFPIFFSGGACSAPVHMTYHRILALKKFAPGDHLTES